MEDLKRMLETLRGEVNSGFAKLNVRILEEVEKKLDTLANTEDYLENQYRRNNIVIYGVPEEGRETWEESEEIVRRVVYQIGVDLEFRDIERAHRVGRWGNLKRPIVCKLAHYKIKDLILRDSKYLRGTGIAISEDYSERVRQERNFLKPHMMEARRQGHHAVLRFDKLVVDGRVVLREELEHRTGASEEEPAGTAGNSAPAEEATMATSTPKAMVNDGRREERRLRPSTTAKRATSSGRGGRTTPAGSPSTRGRGLAASSSPSVLDASRRSTPPRPAQKQQ